MPRNDWKPSIVAEQTAAENYFRSPSLMQQGNDPLPGLLRELVDEIRGLRADIRAEVLQREVAKLPKPIREA